MRPDPTDVAVAGGSASDHASASLAGIAIAAQRCRERGIQQSPAFARMLEAHPPGDFVAAIDAVDPYLGYGHLGASAGTTLTRILQAHGRSGVDDYLRHVQLVLLEACEHRFRESGLPAVFMDEFCSAFSRMLVEMGEVGEAGETGDTGALAGGRRPTGSRDDATMPDDRFLKDLAICRMVLVPCASHVIYRHSGVPRRALARVRRVGELAGLLRVFSGAGMGFRPFMENHVHLAMLDRFDEAGRRRCMELVAALLRAWPDCRGLMGTSWYYDPAVAKVSPKLAYLHDAAAAGGACFIDMGPHPDAEAGALARSATRRALREKGLYEPRNYLMIWSRKDILRQFGGREGA